MLSVACVEPQHSGSVELTTSVSGSPGQGVPSSLIPLFPSNPLPRPVTNAQLKK